MSEIIKDGAALNKRINYTLKTYASVGLRIHVEIVSALWHAAAFGNPFYLNRIYSALRSNDQTAVKLFIRRAHVIVGLEGADPAGLPSEVIQAAAEKGAVVKLTKEEFSIVNGHNTPQAQTLAALCVDRFINPDGKTDKNVLDRNNFAEVKVLGDNEALAQIIKLASSFEESTDTRKVNISKTLADFFAEIKDKATTMKNLTAESLAKG